MSRQPSNHQSSWSARFGQALRRYFLTGVATLFPVAVTLWLVVLIFNFADRFLGRRLGFSIPGLGLLVTIVVILFVGVLSVHFFGRVLFTTIEVWLARLPLVKKIYPTVKQFAQFLFVEDGRQPAFQRVVLVEFPRTGMYSIAFVTHEAGTSVTGETQTLLTLMIPTPPSPLTGPIVFVPKDEVIAVDLSIEDAFKLVLSGGVVTPPLEASRVKPSELKE